MIVLDLIVDSMHPRTPSYPLSLTHPHSNTISLLHAFKHTLTYTYLPYILSPTGGILSRKGSVVVGGDEGGDGVGGEGSMASVVVTAPWPLTYAKLPKEVATSLTALWQSAEDNSYTIGRSFFHSMRDARYQMIQRRRGVHDALSSMFIRLDNRQELFEEFATGFNAIEADFRFDPECCAELHLRYYISFLS